jgi:hypothetical protein
MREKAGLEIATERNTEMDSIERFLHAGPDRRNGTIELAVHLVARAIVLSVARAGDTRRRG